MKYRPEMHLPRRRECGQASLEFAALLIGFGILLLGMIFLCAVSFDNNGILLDAKYRAESGTGSADDGASFASGKEIRSWDYTQIDLFSNGNSISIPFTLADSRKNADANSIGGAGNAFNDESVSVPTPRKASSKNGKEGKEFTYDYKWLSPGGFASDLGDDFTDELSGSRNALDAAELFRGHSQGSSSDTMARFFRNAASDGGSPSRGHTYDWFGLQVREQDLSNAPSNQVYMPKR